MAISPSTPHRVLKKAPCTDAQKLAPSVTLLGVRCHNHEQLIDQLTDIVHVLQQRISVLEDRVAKFDPPPRPTADETFARLERELGVAAP